MPKWALWLPWKEITKAAKKYKFEPELIGAIVQQETAGDPRPRYESHWKYLLDPKKYAAMNSITWKTEWQLQKMSWGLMQVMGSVARELGYEGPLEVLNARDYLSLDLGCKHLRRLQDRWPNLPDAVSSYNQGSPRMSGGDYRNAEYVNSVFTLYRQLKGE